MKIKRFNQLNEGIWSLTKDKSKGEEFLNRLKSFKDDIYNIFGDDDLFNYLDGAEERIKFLMHKEDIEKLANEIMKNKDRIIDGVNPWFSKRKNTYYDATKLATKMVIDHDIKSVDDMTNYFYKK